MHKNLQEILAEAEWEALEMQRYLDRMTSLLHAAARTRDLTAMRLTTEILKEERQEMNRHSDLLNQKLNMLKEGNKMKRVTLFASVLVLLLVFAVGFAVAQDVPLETNTALVEGIATLVESTAIPIEVTEVAGVVPTEEAPVVIINNPPPDPQPASEPTDRVIYVIGFLLFLIYSGVKDYFTTRQTASLVNTVNKGLDNKLVLDESRERYLHASMEVKEFVNVLKAVSGFAGSMNIPIIDPALDKANDFLTDVTSPEPPGPEIPNVRDPDPFKPQYPIDGQPNAFG